MSFPAVEIVRSGAVDYPEDGLPHVFTKIVLTDVPTMERAKEVEAADKFRTAGTKCGNCDAHLPSDRFVTIEEDISASCRGFDSDALSPRGSMQIHAVMETRGCGGNTDGVMKEKPPCGLDIARIHRRAVER